MQQTTRKRGGRWASLGLVIGVLVAGLWLAWPRERLLTRVGRPVARIEGGHTDICWLSAHQVLIVTTEQQGGGTYTPAGTTIESNWHGSADLVDIVTNTRKRLPAFTDLLNRTTKLPLVMVSDFEASPDGVWVQWHAFEHHSDRDLLHASQLDGTHHREWDHDVPAESFFVDAHHLFQETPPKAILGNLLDSKQDREYHKPEQAMGFLTPYIRQKPIFIEVDHPSEDVPGMEIPLKTYRTEDQLRSFFLFDSPREALKPIETHRFKLPEGAELYRGEASPSQKSILYYIHASRTPPFLTWLHHIFPHFRTEPTPTEELWVSRSDGQGVREIGHVRVLADPGHTFLGDIRWLPDGRQISFVYRGMLYVAPAEPEK